jgi:hypothetical protein
MKTFFSFLMIGFLAAGCVNVHVHFPSAPAEKPATAAVSPTSDK